MSVSNIPGNVRIRLWGRSAGRCQYQGCNEALYYDPLTKVQFNTSYIAHIYADSPQGPRYDPVYSSKLKADIANLMLLCDKHHRLIDKEEVNQHPVERLLKMKEEHEQRIDMLTSIIPDKQSHIVLFGANIGHQQVPLKYSEVATAMIPNRYPANLNAIELGIKNAVMEDDQTEYWSSNDAQVKTMFSRYIEPLKSNHSVQHFSVFGLAPIPLLIRLGSLFSDIYDVDVYQRHREPCTWDWQNDEIEVEFIIKRPSNFGCAPALKISLSGTISDDRVTRVIEECSIWEITIPSPHNDFLRTKKILSAFKMATRLLLNEIKLKHGQYKILHVFPAMPISAAIEFGRIWMPKADLPLKIYDQNNIHKNFISTIQLN
jgi:hypothetical protein